MPSIRFPPDFFRRLDESDDADFHAEPRLVTHIGDATIAALTHFYRETLPAGGAILDLMSSWVSHLPADVEYARVAGLGMNRVELDKRRGTRKAVRRKATVIISQRLSCRETLSKRIPASAGRC